MKNSWKFSAFITFKEQANPGVFVSDGHGSQKADVYSFGIILHEILVRKGPFNTNVCENENSKLEPFEIIEKVANPGKHIFWPTW